MKIVETQSAVLSNYEVLTHLQSVHARYSAYSGYSASTSLPTNTTASTTQPQVTAGQGQGQGQGGYRALASVVSDVTSYLLHEKSPLSAPLQASDTSASATTEGKAQLLTVNPHYHAGTARELLQRLRKYNLTKSELLIILNLRPKDLAALDAMVEESDERFTQEQQHEIVAIVADVLGTPDGADQDEA